MTHELIIEGQHVDLPRDFKLTLEWVSGLFEDIGSVQMSRSYTINLPKTARNLRIFDDPGNLSHLSSQSRRYLSASYIRNGIDLLGNARAYIIDMKAASIEIGLLWSIVPGLLEWKDADKNLRDLTLPRLAWIGASGKPDYSSTRRDYLFADYDAGLGDITYPTVPAATHPVVQFSYLLDRIFAEAGVSYRIDGGALSEIYLLADSNKPDIALEYTSGYNASYAAPSINLLTLVFSNASVGWDNMALDNTRFAPGDSDTHFVRLRMRNRQPEFSLAANAILIYGHRSESGRVVSDILSRTPFTVNSSGAEVCSADITLEGLGEYDYYDFQFEAPPRAGYGNLEPFDGSTCIQVARAHDALRPDKVNTFPIAPNIPDLSQVEFMKGAFALLGLVAQPKSDVLVIDSLDNIFDKTGAVDWSEKLVEASEVSLSYSNLAQQNVIAFEEDTWLPESPNAVIVTEDATLPVRSELYKLPFAASYGWHAPHYKVTIGEEDGQKTYELEVQELKPRFFELRQTTDGKNFLVSPYHSRGKGLVSKYYNMFQETVRTPAIINATVRLTELDLVDLDFARPVYFSQLGQYFAVKTVQVEDSNICKVELIRIR